MDFAAASDLMRRTRLERPLQPMLLFVLSRGLAPDLPSDLPSAFPAAFERAWQAGQNQLAALLPRHDT